MSRNKHRNRGMSFEMGDACKPKYPTIEGVAIDPLELDLPESRLSPENSRNWNNHHGEFYSRWFGANVLFRTFVNLETNQYGMLIDTHDLLHRKYGPPQFPTPYEALTVIEQEYDDLGRLRYGSQNNPEFKPILGSLMQEIDRCYTQLGGRQDKTLIDMGAQV